MKKGKCRSCGAKLEWIETASGRKMPCNEDQVYYTENPKGKDKVVTPDGQVLRCDIIPEDGPLDQATGWGYQPHWATCPDADKFRKKKGANNGTSNLQS